MRNEERRSKEGRNKSTLPLSFTLPVLLKGACPSQCTSRYFLLLQKKPEPEILITMASDYKDHCTDNEVNAEHKAESPERK